VTLDYLDIDCNLIIDEYSGFKSEKTISRYGYNSTKGFQKISGMVMYYDEDDISLVFMKNNFD